MDLSFFEDESGNRLTPPPAITLDDVKRVISKHNASNNKAIRVNVERYLISRQWEWLAVWEPWKAQNDDDLCWNANVAGTVSHTESVFVVDNPETGEGHYEDQDVLHEARELEPEEPRPALVTVDEWLAQRNLSVEQFRVQREQAIAKAVVTTAAGNKFDADEKGITRMMGKILRLRDAVDSTAVNWVLADSEAGIFTQITLGELKEAYDLASDNLEGSWFR